MPQTVECDIVSAEHAIFNGKVEMVIATGALGDLGIAPGHAPLLTTLDPGPVRVYLEGGEEEVFYVSGGMLEVQPRIVTILADTAIRADNLDAAAAEDARQHAARDLLDQKSEIDYGSAAARLAEAAAQLRAINQIRKKMGR